MGANFKWETLGSIAGANWELGIKCRCGREATLDAKLLSKVFRERGWDDRKHMIPQRLRCTKCGKRPCRVGISANKPDPPLRGPMRLKHMRKDGLTDVRVDCSCFPTPDTLNVDHLSGSIPVPDVRFHVVCPGCGSRPLRTMPTWNDPLG